MIDKQQEYIFYTNDGKRFQGNIIEEDETHFRVYDKVADKRVLLPKALTRLEEVK